MRAARRLSPPTPSSPATTTSSRSALPPFPPGLLENCQLTLERTECSPRPPMPLQLASSPERPITPSRTSMSAGLCSSRTTLRCSSTPPPMVSPSPHSSTDPRPPCPNLTVRSSLFLPGHTLRATEGICAVAEVYCTMFKDNVLADFSNTAAFLRSVLANGIAATVGQRVPNEPLLQPYVCQRGYAAAADCKPVSGFTNNYSR